MQDYIKNIYEKKGYLDKYGGSVVITFLTIIVVFIILSYFYIQSNIKPLKANWAENKCKPYVLPFAGLINPQPGKTIFEFTGENFSYCISMILGKVVDTSTLPLKYTSSLLTKLFTSLMNQLQKLREIFNFIRLTMLGIISDIMGRILNVMTQLRKILINVNVIFDKVKAVMLTALYTLVASYMALKSFMGAFLEIIIKILIILAALIIIMWIFPWTWAAAGTMTALFLLVSIPFAALALSLGRVMNLTTDNDMPNEPEGGCFDENTIVNLKKGTKKMKNINPGDILENGSTITAIFKIANTNTIMYKLNDIIVTGEHKVKYKQFGWINVKEHPKAIEINNYNKNYIYCLNTSNKIIEIDNFTFMDWDEVDSLDIEKLKYSTRKYITNEFKTELIHKYLDGGFIGSTKIELEDGRVVNIKDLEPNDQLKYGERVFAIVKIDARSINVVRAYSFGDFKFVGGPNIRISDNKLGKLCTLDFYGESVDNINYLYHIVTNNKFFIMNGIRFYDYNGLLEPIIWESKKFVHSI